MNLKVRKRDGKLQDFNGDKIVNATRKAFEETKESYEKTALDNVVDYVYGAVKEEEIVDIEEIQDYVETFLIENQYVKTAKAYISVLGDEQSQKDTLAGLKSAEGFIRVKLAKNINLRNTPQIKFILDQSIEYGVRMSKKIDEVTKDLKDRDSGAEE